MSDAGSGEASPAAPPRRHSLQRTLSFVPRAAKDQVRDMTIEKKLRETAEQAKRARDITNSSQVPALKELRQVQPHIVRKVCTTGTSTMMLTYYGALYLWGDPDAQLPLQLPAFEGLVVVDIACGLDHYCAVTDESTWNLYAWGGNKHGQLGTGDRDPLLEPAKVTALTPTVETVVAGDEFTLVRCLGGDVVGFGRNDRDQLGTGQPGPDHLTPVFVDRLSVRSPVQQPFDRTKPSGPYRPPSGAIELAARGAHAAMWTARTQGDGMIAPSERWEVKELERAAEHLGHTVRATAAEYQDMQARFAFPKFCPDYYSEADAYVKECTSLLRRNSRQRDAQHRKVEWLRQLLTGTNQVAGEQEAELQDGQLRLAKTWRLVQQQHRQIRKERESLEAQSEEERDNFHLRQLQDRLQSAEAGLREDKRHLDALYLSVKRSRGRIDDVRLRLLHEQHLAADHDKEVDLLFRLRLRRLKILQRKLLQDRDDYFRRVVQAVR